MFFVHWLRARIQGVINSWVERAIAAGLLAGAYALWRYRDDLPGEVTTPTWVLVALALAALIAIGAAIVWGRRWMHAAAVADEAAENMLDIAYDTENARAVVAAYADHLSEILGSLERVLAGALAGVSVADFLEKGVLQPARDYLMPRQGEDVRLSILVPDGDDFVMPFAAGHTLNSQRNFRIPIQESFSRYAFQTGDIAWSDDLESDPRFRPHTRAQPGREYNSIISVPLQSADHTFGVFNAISTPSDAFDEADLRYVKSLGAIIELVWRLGQIGQAGRELEPGGEEPR